MENCNICVEPYNRSVRNRVQCEFCGYSSCRACCAEYILQSKESAKCMNCKRDWDEKSLNEKFTTKFINGDLRNHYADLLLEREKQLLPATQLVIEDKKRKQGIKEDMTRIKRAIFKLNGVYARLNEELKKEPNQLKKFVQKCPNEVCVGYLDENLVCSLCKTNLCNECNQIKTIGHQCKDEDVATVCLIRKETRPCPRCGEGISKVNGCDQMWCTQCHTTFSWSTGVPSNTKNIHNPHYIEHQNNLARNPLDIQCGREIDNVFIYNYFVDTLVGPICYNIRYTIFHLQRLVNREFDNQNLRIKFLNQQINEKQFRILLHRREKQIKKNAALAEVLAAFVGSATDIIYRLAYEVGPKAEKNVVEELFWKTYAGELNQLIVYTNGWLEEVSKVYKCPRYVVNNCLFGKMTK